MVGFFVVVVVVVFFGGGSESVTISPYYMPGVPGVLACVVVPSVFVPSEVLVTSSVLVSIIVTSSVVPSSSSAVVGSVVVGSGTEQSGMTVPFTHSTFTFTPISATSSVDRELMRLKIPSAGISLFRTRASSRGVVSLPSVVVILVSSCSEPCVN